MRTLPSPGFGGDEGEADPALAAALAAHDAAPDSREHWHRAVAALQDTRVLVPVVATPAGGRAGAGGRAESRPTDDKLTDMSAVLMQGRSGATALLAFTGLEALRRWDPEARPVPVRVGLAATAALQNGAEALVVDVAGPVLLAVEGEDLRSLALGHRLVEVAPGRWGWGQVGEPVPDSR